MGLLLRPDAYYAETPDGAYVMTHHGPLSFTGKSIYPLLDRLASYLDGSRSLPDLTARLSPQRGAAVTQLITTLLKHGAVREINPTFRGYPAELSFLGYFNDSPAQAFEHYRVQNAVVSGDGPLAAAIAAAAERSGLRQITTLPNAPHTELVVGGWRARAVIVGGECWFSLEEPGTTDRESAWLRLAARPALELDRVPDRVAAAAVAARLVHAVFRRVTGVAQPQGNRLTRIDLTTLCGGSHPYLPHPFARPAQPETAADFLQRAGALAAAAPLDPESFSRKAIACADDRIGVIGRPAEHDFAQIPLHVCEMAVPDPAGVQGSCAAIGVGLDFTSARHNTALRAFAIYSSLMLDKRRLLGEDNLAEVWGLDLATGRPRKVSAASVFPAGGETYVPPVGLAAAFSWDDAVRAGVLEQCRRLTLHQAVTSRRISLVGRTTRYLSILDAAGARVTANDITGPFGVPTVRCYLNESPAGCASGATLAEALEGALAETVLRWQTGAGHQFTVPSTLDVAAVARRLERHGHRLVAVPLDHDPEVHAVMPNAVQVVVVGHD